MGGGGEVRQGERVRQVQGGGDEHTDSASPSKLGHLPFSLPPPPRQ